MNPLEIALIVIGIVIIIISCRLVENKGKEQNLPAGMRVPLERNLSEEEKKNLREKIEELFAELREDALIQTDEALSKLSNEKIMAVHEFSDQILEKVKRNHEEVVFLYNMLNDKEKDLKAVVREMDSSTKKVKDILEAKVDTEVIHSVKNVKTQIPKKQALNQTANQKVPMEKVNVTSTNSLDYNPEPSMLDSFSTNFNSQILALHSQGKSVIEISKLLGMGQGEVKLVIDLFKGKK